MMVKHIRQVRNMRADAFLGLGERGYAWAQFPLRLIVGYGFIAHGIAKLERGPDNFAHILQVLGVAEPHLFAWLTILVEVLGGIAVLLGAFVRIASPLVEGRLVRGFEGSDVGDALRVRLVAVDEEQGFLDFVPA